MKYKLSICDDMPYFVDDMKQEVEKYAKNENITVDIDTFTDSKKFFESFIQVKYQVVFLDIEMPGIDGIEI